MRHARDVDEQVDGFGGFARWRNWTLPYTAVLSPDAGKNSGVSKKMGLQ